MTRTKASAAALAYQDEALLAVSRTFALTIPQLPEPLRTAVGNAYLLCRIADTIEDEASMTTAEKAEFANRFIDVLGGESPQAFANDLLPHLRQSATPAEKTLIAKTPTVIDVTRSCSDAQQEAMARCVQIMARGMAEYQKRESLAGLRDVQELDQYCYYVAGVVGEMLTELFCDHVPSLAPQRDLMLKRAVAFGQGLQMTNIIKDTWDDRTRGACWLPQDVFQRHGVELERLEAFTDTEGHREAINELVDYARQNLDEAINYTLAIPPDEPGIRRFCLWAIGMAVLTLRKVNARPGFRSGAEVKISRRSVKATIGVSNSLVRWNGMLRGVYYLTTRQLQVDNNHATIERIAG